MFNENIKQKRSPTLECPATISLMVSVDVISTMFIYLPHSFTNGSSPSLDYNSHGDVDYFQTSRIHKSGRFPHLVITIG